MTQQLSHATHNGGSFEAFEDWFDTLCIHVLDATGVDFQDEDAVRQDYEAGKDVFDVIDEIVEEYGGAVRGRKTDPSPEQPAFTARKGITSEEAVVGKVQHTKACSDCPWRRDSLKGWLGGHSPEEFVHIAHSDTRYDCHTLKGQQCAGMAIYRRNTCKRVDPPLLTLPADHEHVFSNRREFLGHHELKGVTF